MAIDCLSTGQVESSIIVSQIYAAGARTKDTLWIKLDFIKFDAGTTLYDPQYGLACNNGVAAGG